MVVKEQTSEICPEYLVSRCRKAYEQDNTDGYSCTFLSEGVCNFRDDVVMGERPLVGVSGSIPASVLREHVV